MTKRVAINALMAAMLLSVLPGCAGLLNKGKQSVVVNSTPPGASVYVEGRQVGTTPYTYVHEAEDGGTVNLELRKEGHGPVMLSLRPRRSNGVLLADAMLLGIPYIVDAKSKAMYSFASQEVGANLFKDMPEGHQRVEVPVESIELALPAPAGWGKSGSRSLTINSKELHDLRYPQNATGAVVQAMAETWADATLVIPGTARGDEAIRRAKVLLRPVVKGFDVRVKEAHHRVHGSVQVDMAWQFFDGLAKDSLLFTVDKRIDVPVNGAGARELVDIAMRDATRQLMDEPGLYDRLAAAYTHGLLLSKGEAVALKAPVPVAFTDRKRMIPAVVKGVVTVEMEDGHGSGFLITNDGYILTNAHVVGDQAKATVRFEQGFSLEGQVVKVNRDFDVALVKVAGNDLPALAIGSDEELVLGEELFAIGTPLSEQLGQSVTRGIMSGKREIEGRRYLQTDVSINPGNSGGPLVDDQGRVVGIATMKAKTSGVEGIGFGVPITTALEMLNIEFTE